MDEEARFWAKRAETRATDDPGVRHGDPEAWSTLSDMQRDDIVGWYASVVAEREKGRKKAERKRDFGLCFVGAAAGVVDAAHGHADLPLWLGIGKIVLSVICGILLCFGVALLGYLTWENFISTGSNTKIQTVKGIFAIAIWCTVVGILFAWR